MTYTRKNAMNLVRQATFNSNLRGVTAPKRECCEQGSVRRVSRFYYDVDGDVAHAVVADTSAVHALGVATPATPDDTLRV